MKNDVQQDVRNYDEARRRARRLKIIIFILDAIVILLTAYALILPAITY